MTKMYGIPNCDTIKKARKWLDNKNIDYTFHNYKKDGVPEKNLRQWVKKLGWEILLNRRGTTWRKLDDKTKNTISESSAIKLMLENPSIIKRPVLESKARVLVGFDEAEYKKLS